jgi:hypothetical protein
MIAGDDAAGAGHICDDDGGIPWNESAQVARDQSRIDIGAAAGWKSDDNADNLASVKFFNCAVAGGQVLLLRGKGWLRRRCGQNESYREKKPFLQLG